MNRRTFLAAAALAPGGFCPPPAFGQPKEKVKIVSVLPRTGGSKGVTDGIVNAINLALADFEKALPFEVIHVERDDAHPRRGAWDVDRETSIAAAAAADRGVLAVIGSYYSGAAHVSAPIFNKAGLVQVSPSATLTGLTKSGPASDADEPGKYRPAQKITFCRVCPYDGSQGVLSAQFAAAELKAQSVYVLDDKHLYGSGAAGVFKKQCEALKLKVAGAESVSITQSDFGPLTQRIKDKNPDLVYFGGTTQSKAGQLAREMVRAQLACPLVLPDACYEDAFIDSAGRALDALKVYVTVGGINPAHLKGAGADFVKRYTGKFDKAPDADAVYGYEAAAVVLEALRAAGKRDREAVRRAVLSTTDFAKGLLGGWSFDADGDTTHQPLTVTTVEKGKFRAVKVLGAK
ncbi:MAG: branched-chain amino acid ABC transporter substrate-binding protein [Gemmata sp.]